MVRFKNNRSGKGFSLIELVIVVVIIGIIAAIAIPRMSRGTAGAADSALGGNLAVLRNAIELYSTEHNSALPGNTTGVTAEEQLTKFSATDGTVKDAKDTASGHIYGPYLRRVPPVPVGSLKNDNAKNAKFATGTSDTAEATPSAGWLYNKSSGTIKANVPDGETDQNGRKYNEY